MFKVTIIKLKDIAKIMFIMIAIYFLVKLVFNNVNKFPKKNIKIDMSNFMFIGINEQCQFIKNLSGTNNTENEEQTEEVEGEYSFIEPKSIFKIASNVFHAEKKENDAGQDKNINPEVQEVDVTQSKEEKTQISTDTTTEVVTKNPLPENYNREYNGVKIKNETDFELANDILNPENLQIDSKNVIIFHTHTCESYTESENYKYTPSGNYRTTDLNYSVVRVGDELSKLLSGYGFNVNHNNTYHDYPAYTGSYTRSLSSVKNILNSFSSDIIIDLHRDAIGSNSNYAPTVKIGDDYCAQIMFVIGTNGGGLYHPNWSSNLKFAVKVQKKANELFPRII